MIELKCFVHNGNDGTAAVRRNVSEVYVLQHCLDNLTLDLYRPTVWPVTNDNPVENQANMKLNQTWNIHNCNQILI